MMQEMRKEARHILALATAITLFACEEAGDLLRSEADVETDVEVITIKTNKDSDNNSETRGTLITDVDQMQSLGIYAAYTSSDLWKVDTEFSKIANQEFKYEDSAWQCEEGAEPKWEGNSASDNYTFYSYAPFQSTENGISTSIADGELSISYTVPTECANQPDLMIARPKKDIRRPVNGTISFDLFHTLAAIEFKVRGAATLKVSSVAISGIKDSGTLTWDYVDDEPQWIDLTNSSYTESGEGIFSAIIDTEVEPNEEIATDLTATNGYLMMIPQEITEGQTTAIVTITDSTNGTITTKELSIPTIEWQAGELYTYTIYLDDSYDETQITQTANSYMLHPSESSIEYYYIPVDTRANLFWGDSDYGYNASNIISTDSEGNAVTGDGRPVKAALLMYDCETFDSSNFEVEVVTSGFSAQGVTSAMLGAGNVSDFTDSGCTVALRIKLGATYNGNISVAVYKQVDNSNTLLIDGNGLTNGGNTILWSWHLWVTNYNPNIIAYENRSNITPNSNAAFYGGRRQQNAVHRYTDSNDAIKLWDNGGIYANKFIMDRNLGAMSTSLEGNGNGTSYGVGALYFQYGRKDPFVGESGYYLNNKGEFSQLTDPYTHRNQDDFTTAVTMPLSIFVGSTTWCNENIDSASCLWNDKNVSSDSASESYGKKSLFDPSPLGWRIPVDGVWSNFSQSNFIWESKNGCYYPNDSGFAFYPASGYRRNTNYKCANATNYGYCWSASASEDGYGYRLYFDSDDIYTSSNHSSISSLPIRAIQE
ncbi:MAG: fimbrillin family protein [Rikenellaceae bacterium]